MEAPKCKICDKRHYGLCVVNSEVEKAPEIIPFMPISDHYQAYLKAREWKRNYMREYMRKRRAAEKQGDE